VFVAAAMGATVAHADLVINGTGDFNVNGVPRPGQNFTIEFIADQPAVDLMSDTSRGLFVGTTTLTLANLGLVDVVSTNINALRQDQNPQGLFLANVSNPFNAGFTAVFPQSGVITDPNVLVSLSEVPQSVNFQGAGLEWQLADGSTVRINQVAFGSVEVSALAAVPEPAATAILIVAGMSLMAVRRKKCA